MRRVARSSPFVTVLLASLISRLRSSVESDAADHEQPAAERAVRPGATRYRRF